MEVERVGLEAVGHGQSFECKSCFVGFIEAYGELIAGGSEGGV